MLYWKMWGLSWEGWSVSAAALLFVVFFWLYGKPRTSYYPSRERRLIAAMTVCAVVVAVLAVMWVSAGARN